MIMRATKILVVILTAFSIKVTGQVVTERVYSGNFVVVNCPLLGINSFRAHFKIENNSLIIEPSNHQKYLTSAIIPFDSIATIKRFLHRNFKIRLTNGDRYRLFLNNSNEFSAATHDVRPKPFRRPSRVIAANGNEIVSKVLVWGFGGAIVKPFRIDGVTTFSDSSMSFMPVKFASIGRGLEIPYAEIKQVRKTFPWKGVKIKMKEGNTFSIYSSDPRLREILLNRLK